MSVPDGSGETATTIKHQARIAIDLGAESCRVSLLQWINGEPLIQLIHRVPNGPIHAEGSLRWPFDTILAGLEVGLRKAALSAPEGIASVAVDGWAVDYVRLEASDLLLSNPYCYRDERTIRAKEAADQAISPQRMFELAGAQPLRINTVYQLVADRMAGADTSLPWVCLPEYVLCWLGGRRVAEYTNATHTGLVDLETGDWSQDLIAGLDISSDPLPPIVPSGTVVGRLSGTLAQLPSFRNTALIAPACHDTASAIAGISRDLDRTAYICSGTWSLVGTVVDSPITGEEAFSGGFTNQGAAGGGFLFHTNVNGMWLLKQCLESWSRAGRSWELERLIALSAECQWFPGTVPVDAPSLLLDGDMPSRINELLRAQALETIEDRAGNEPIFARVIFESLAVRYAEVLRSLEHLLGYTFERLHILGGGSRNQLLARLTAERTGLQVERGNVESSTIGNFAVQLAASESRDTPIDKEAIRHWALCLATVELSTAS